MTDLPFMLAGVDLSQLPGAPTFSNINLMAAIGGVRSELGWHLAPEVTETLIVDSVGGLKLWLPTRHVVSVSAVKVRADDGTETDLEGWSATTGWSVSGWLYNPCGFPSGERRIRVDLTHGYFDVPAEIVAIVAARLQPYVTSETIGSRSVTVSAPVGSGASASAILARYGLGPRP